MKKLKFDININAPRKKVWDTMLQPETYREWTNVSWPGSSVEGEWKEGKNLRFASPGQGGTLATVIKHKPFEQTMARHIAVINPDGTEDRESEVAKGWIGSTERYSFAERDGKTTLTVDIETPPEWEPMFQDGWPAALKKLKEISER